YVRKTLRLQNSTAAKRGYTGTRTSEHDRLAAAAAPPPERPAVPPPYPRRPRARRRHRALVLRPRDLGPFARLPRRVLDDAEFPGRSADRLHRPHVRDPVRRVPAVEAGATGRVRGAGDPDQRPAAAAAGGTGAADDCRNRRAVHRRDYRAG